MIRFQSVPRDLTLFCPSGIVLHAYQELFCAFYNNCYPFGDHVVR